MPHSAGDKLGPYEIVAFIGAGGMGEVYKARDTRLDRIVAVKVSKEQFSEHFEREARTVAALNHPNICTLYDVGPNFLVMEFLEGETLRDRLRLKPLPVETAIEYAAHIADALADAHAHGVVHRDLKPENIMLTRNGVKVLDFGIARRIPPGGEILTETIGVLGTPAYMSPEQVAGRIAGPPADLFSLGLTLYEMIAGRPPIPGASLGRTIESGGGLEFPPLSRLCKHAPAGLCLLVMSMLEREPDRRPKGAAEVRDRLANLRAGKTAPRWRIQIAAVVLLAIAAGTWLALRPVGVAGTASHSVAVMPFVNKTGKPELDYVVDGATSDLIRRLALIPQLRVISPASVMALKGKALAPTAAAQRLGVDTIISGSVGADGKDAALEIEASEGRDGSILFARRYAPHEPDVFRLLSTAAEDIAAGMKVRLDRGTRNDLKKVLTSNREALDSYLRAQPMMLSDDPRQIARSIDLLSDSVKKDPKFALAVSALAIEHGFLGTYYEDPRIQMPIAKSLAKRALEIDETLRDPHGLLGLIALVYDWDYDEARRQLILLSGRMQPAAMQLLGCTSHLLVMSGRWNRDAEAEVRSALEANPISVALMAELGCTAYYGHNFERAVQAYNRALETQPANVTAVWGLGKTYAQMGKYQEALDALNRVSSTDGMAPPVILGEQGYVYGLLKNRRKALLLLDRLSEMGRKAYVDPLFRAEIYLGLGENAKVLEALNEAVNVRSTMIISIQTDPKWEPLHRDPGFQKITATMSGN
jgi:eukaryotic-like serine/threonine-protein kinase